MNQSKPPLIPNGLAYLVRSPKPKEETFQVGEYTVTANANVKEPPVEGTVVCVGDADGPDIQDRCKYRAGQLVVFGRYAGQPWKHDGTEYIILAENEILGRICE